MVSLAQEKHLDLGSYIFERICSAAQQEGTTAILPYPSLIYKFLAPFDLRDSTDAVCLKV